MFKQWVQEVRDSSVETKKRTIYFILGGVLIILITAWLAVGNKKLEVKDNKHFIQQVNDDLNDNKNTISNPLE
jgi:tetrahydromethanopterin S-methyltransferase subunit E